MKENPEDDTPRLIFADWLADHGEPERGEFLRLQCRVAQTREADEQERLHQHITALLEQHQPTWLAPLEEIPRGYVNWRRGLLHINIATVPSRRTAERLAATEAWAWVEGLELNHHDWDDAIGVLAKSPLLTGITVLEADEVMFEETGMRGLARSPYAANLSRLVFSEANIGDNSIRALTRSPYLHRLTHLDLENNSITDAGMKALAACPHLSGLRRLDLSNNGITLKGWQALAASPYLSGITRLHGRQHNLDLDVNSLGDEGVAKLVASPT
jgi:uncharacterized protein (TIGR02996 family)